MRWLLLSLLLFFAAARGAESMQTDRFGNPILDQYSEEGFVDCVFKISDLVETATHYRFRTVSTYKGEIVGMNVAVVKGIQAGFDAEMHLANEHVYRKGVVFLRSGPESDRLISALSFLYTGTTQGLAMVDEESFTAIALHQGDIKMERQPIKIKIFGRDAKSDNVDDYYESFFNLDLKNGLVFWNEKDADYRKPLIRALSK
jgi:hypothetical protein